MADQSQDSVKEIRHYMRPTATSRAKTVVVERVQSGSATFEFLERMEVRRKRQECMLRIDMRGKVPYECRRYTHRGREYWLDDISYELFKQGLKNHDGVLTVGVYEDIVNGEHTHQGARRKREREEAERMGTANRVEQGAREPQHIVDPKFLPQSPIPEIIPLGYYHARREERLQHTTSITVSTAKGAVPMKTRDLSPNGLKVYSKHAVSLARDDVVTLTFNAFNDEFDAGLDAIEYRVTALEETEHEYRFCLAKTDDGDRRAYKFVNKFIDQHMQGARRRRKLCHEDERLTAYSMMAELFYTLSTPIIPIFFVTDPDAQPQLAHLCKNANNEHALGVFRMLDSSYDFRSLSASQRVAGLLEKARDDGQSDPLIAVYRPDAEHRPLAICDHEFARPAHWLAFVRKHLKDEHFRLFKVLSRPMQRPDPLKIFNRIEKLSDKSIDSAQDLVEHVDTVVAAGALVDITAQAADWDYSQADADLDAWAQAAQTAAEAAAMEGDQPNVLRLGYIEQRHEDRYTVRLGAEVTLAGTTYEGQTRDISVRGLCVELDEMPIGMHRGDQVAITFPALHRRAKQRVKLTNLSYEITCLERTDKVLLHLRRVPNDRSKDHTLFFQDLIERNAQRIKADLSDSITAGRSRLFGSIAAESAASVPLFLLRDGSSGERELKVALPMSPGLFAQFFETAPGEYDFSAITDSTRLAVLTSELRKNETVELVLYLFKRQVPGCARFEIYSAAESEFSSTGEKYQFLQKALAHDYCAIKIVVGATQAPPEPELHAAMEQLMERAPQPGHKLRQIFNQLVLVGEVVDITRQAFETTGLLNRLQGDSAS